MTGKYLGFHETMSGYYDGRLFEFTIDAYARRRDAIHLLGKGLKLDIEGIVTMQDVCEDAEVQQGTLLLDFMKNHELVYDFRFDAERDGKDISFSYRGQKNISLLAPVHSMTTLYGRIQNLGNPEERYISVCKFDLKDLPKFLLSFYEALKRE